MILVPCCAATYDYDRGTGRHLAANLPEELHELPQVISRWRLTKNSRIRNNQKHWWTNANYDEIKNDEMIPKDTMTVELEERYSRDDARTHLRVEQKDDRDCARLFHPLPVPINGRSRVHDELQQVAKHRGSKGS